MSESTGVMLEAREVSYSYLPGDGAPFALKGINLAIKRGEYVSVIGPSGSGKTTLLKSFNGLLKPTAGEVRVNGLLTSHEPNLWPLRRSCSMIFQNPDNQLVTTTVEEEIAFGLENYGVPSEQIREQVNWVMEKLNISHLAQYPPHYLSGGEKQKVAVASVLVMQPQCLLADEPTSMLDPVSRRELQDLLRSLRRELGLTLVQVVHYLEEAAAADRVLLLYRGQVAADGPPGEVLTDLNLLHDSGLLPVTAVELAAFLREDGLALPKKIVSNQELVDSICSLKQKS